MTKAEKIIKLLLRNTRVDVNALNVYGSTALDVLLESSDKSSVDARTKRRLRSAGGKRSKDINRKIALALGCFGESKRKKQLKKEDDWLNDAGNTLMVVAILIATVTYQTGLSPPGGVWQGEFNNVTTISSNISDYNISNYSGLAILGIKDKAAYSYFIIYNTMGFAASLSIILLLISGFPI
ncbi:uncharacterized protein LOC143878136 [Tasmannia lanceolata]|uniref:uncharacterized protein LOC143878136 n=1 Tax=Tasmannia lanceolata TaxID=3420 RepID=UPI004063DF8A